MTHGPLAEAVSPEGFAPGILRPEGLRIPPLAPRMRIGLYGGSFNPPHAAHRAASLLALKRLRLDRVWWLVTPGNPLKDNGALPPLSERIALAREVARHPALVPTGCEALLGTRYSYDTVAALVRRFPQVDFVWLMGADNLAGFHRWQRWRALADLVPIAVIDRPGSTFRAMGSPAAAALAPWRVDERQAPRLAGLKAPAWLFLHGLKSPLSSTMLREAAARGQGANQAKNAANARKSTIVVENRAVLGLS